MEDKIYNSQNDLIKVILANTSSAMKISKILCEHSEDKILKADEIICGLIYRLMIPMSDNEISESLQEAEDIMYDDSSDEEQEIEIVDDKEELNIMKKVRTNNCNCNICSQVRACLCNFQEHIPKDELGDKFKKSIVETCKSHNRYI